MKKIVTLFSCIAFATTFFCCGQNEKSNYSIVNHFHIEGDGGWDYLAMDESTGRLFVSHSTVTQVLDSKTGQLLGTIQDTKGVHGIAMDHKLNRAFISCGRDSTVTVINLKTLEFITKIKVTGANPDAILYDPFSDKVLTYNGRSANATVIDPNTNAVVKTIPLAGKPEFSATDGHGTIYVNIEDKSLITVIDAKTLEVVNTWPLAPGEEPTGLALDNTTHRLFSVCGNAKMVVMDAQNGKIISVLDTGHGTDGCGFDPELKRAYSSNGEGTLSVIQEDDANTFSLLGNVQTARGARTICVDAKTHHVYLPTAEYGPPPKATPENPHPWPSIKPGTFTILDVALQ